MDSKSCSTKGVKLMEPGTENHLAVRVNNEMQKIPLVSLQKKGMDLFMGICARAKNRGDEKIIFTFPELRELCAWGHHVTGGHKGYSDHDLYENLIKVSKTIAGLFTQYTEQYMRDGKLYERSSLTTLFKDFVIDEGEKTLTVSVSPHFTFMLNDIAGEGFTQFQYSNYLSLSSKYTKEIFRHLMQRKNGNPRWDKKNKDIAVWAVSMDDFRTLLNIPDGYTYSKINNQILKPAEDELSKIFNQFKIERQKKKGSRSFTSLVFSFESYNKAKKELKDATSKLKQWMIKESDADEAYSVLSDTESTCDDEIFKALSNLKYAQTMRLNAAGEVHRVKRIIKKLA